MGRSKRADKIILVERLKKFAVIVFMLAFVGGIVALGRWAGTHYVPAAVPVEDFTYMNYPGDSSLTYFENYPEAEELPDYPENPPPAVPILVATIPTSTPGVYRPPIIALTFDDGPGRNTMYLLDVLDYFGGRVTFCVIGNLVEYGEETVRRAFESGHEIVGHSWEHPNMGRFNVQQIVEQIEKTAEIIEYVTGAPPVPLFRVPFGHFTGPIQRAAIETGYGVLNWSIDPMDWHFRDPEIIYEHIMYAARDGAIIVLHDIHITTVYAMKLVIPALMYQGFELVTASEVIYHIYGGIVPGFEFTGTRG